MKQDLILEVLYASLMIRIWWESFSGVSVFIQQIRRGRVTQYSQFVDQDPKVNRMDQSQIVEVLNRYKLNLSHIEKTEGKRSPSGCRKAF